MFDQEATHRPAGARRPARQQMEAHFPVNVLLQHHAGVEGLNARLLEAVDGVRRAHENSTENAARNGKSTTRGGFQTPASMDFLSLDDAAVRELRQCIILPAIEQYLHEVWQVNPLLTPFTVKGWANVLGQGHWQAPHMHPMEFNIISGVYYVDVPPLAEPSGCIEFINPHPVSVCLGGQSATRLHQPETGQLLLFPPYYMHFVHPVSEPHERTVIAFDVKLTPPSP